MDPPSPSKLVMSPGMPIFPISPERVAGTKPPYGEPAPSHSPSVPLLGRFSPVRSPHRRTDSDVSVVNLAAKFENLRVKDHEQERAKFVARIEKMEKDQQMQLARKDVRIEELQEDLARMKEKLQSGITRTQFEKEHQEHKSNVAKWEKVFKENEEKWKQDRAKWKELEFHNRSLEAHRREYKKRYTELKQEMARNSNMVPILQQKIRGLQSDVTRAESDVNHKTEVARKYQHEVDSLEIKLQDAQERLVEETQKLRDQLKLIEGERDALKTSLKEEEILRIAAEGQIPLPSTDNDDNDEFKSPVRSPRKQRAHTCDDDDKENVAPRRGPVDVRFIQQELETEKRMRIRAEEQIDFMKMECQFQCCSCRIADNNGKTYVYDNAFAAEIQRIKLAVSIATPPSSHHGDDAMHIDNPPQDSIPIDEPATSVLDEAAAIKQPCGTSDESHESTVLVNSKTADTEMTVAFSPSTGTFRSFPSPIKATPATTQVTPNKIPHADTIYFNAEVAQSSPWTPDAHGTVFPVETTSPMPTQPRRRSASFAEFETGKLEKQAPIEVHEDALYDSGIEQEANLQPQESSNLATPYLTRTVTTTTTIPLHFSPATPAFRPGKGPVTPSTIAHAAPNARTPVLSELSLNNLGGAIDKEKARAEIQRRRARSMADNRGTPLKQMIQGVKDRRDISAPVSRVRR